MPKATKKKSAVCVKAQAQQKRHAPGFVNDRAFRQIRCERDDLGFEVVWCGSMCQPDSATKGELLERYDSRRGDSPARLARLRHRSDE